VDSFLTGLNISSTATVNIDGPNAASIVLLGGGITQVIGTQTLITAQALDQFGNVDSGFTANIDLLISGNATGPVAVSIVSGVGSFQVNDSVVEDITISLVDNGTFGALDLSSSAIISYVSGPATALILSSVNP